VKHCCILSYFFFTPLFLLVSFALTVINTRSACLFDFHDGQINPRTFGAALTSRSSGQSGSLMLMSCCMSDSTSAVQSSLLSYGLSKSPILWSQWSVSEMLPCALSSTHSTGWLLILGIWQKFKIWVRPPGKSFADNGGDKADYSDKVNAAAPSCWKMDRDALMISSVFEMYPTVVVCLYWARDSLWVACRFWLPWLISKNVMNLGHSVQCGFFHLFVHFRVVFWVHCIQYWVSACQNPVIGWSKLPYSDLFAKSLACGFDCLQPISSLPRE